MSDLRHRTRGFLAFPATGPCLVEMEATVNCARDSVM